MTAWRYWSEWAAIERVSTGLYTVPNTLFGGPSPYLDSNDDAASYVQFTQEPGFDYSTMVVLRFPAGVDLETLTWLGGSYDPATLPGPPAFEESNPGFRRFEVAERIRFSGAEPASGTRPRVLHGIATWDGANWGTSLPFSMYASPWHTDWADVYSGATTGQASVDFWQSYADSGDLGFWIRWTTVAVTAPDQWWVDLSYVALVVPSLSTPPLRQNQRDDLRQNQRTSQQLTVRQRGYL